MDFGLAQPSAFALGDSASIYSDPHPNVLKPRTRRPCDACRRRKSRCELTDGRSPCVLCSFHHQECTFIEEPQPRKRRATEPAEEDVSTSAGTAATMFASPSDTQKAREDQRAMDYAELKGPSLLKETLGLQNHRHGRFIGSTSVYEEVILQLGDFQGNQEITIVGQSSLRMVDHSTTAFTLSPDAGTRDYEDEIRDLDAIENIVAPHGQALIYLYFRIVHPSFPILHKKVFLEKYQRTHREFSPSLLAAVYLLALNWWSYSRDLALLPKPDVPQLETLAFKTMNNIIHRPKLSTIQAGLLLLQRPEGDSWPLTTQLVGVGQELGLHMDCSNWRIPAWERGLRKRLGWALFMQDKWGALVHGRPSHIFPSEWAAKPLEDDDFPENATDEDNEDGSTEVEKGRTLFCEMIKLTSILAAVLSTFYSMNAHAQFAQHAEAGVRWILEKAKPIQMSLKQWYTDLPAVLRMGNLATRKLCSTGYLHLGYYAVEITLHRQIIRSLSSVDDLSLRSICRQAAQARLKSAMEFVQNLRPEHLQSFWYSASKYCFALVGTFISLLWVTALEVEEAESYKAKIHEYQWILRLSSKSADFMERALNMLATSTGILVKGIPERPDVKAILDRRRPLTYATGSIHSAHEENTSQPGIVNGHPAMGYHENAAPGPIASEAMLYEDGWDNDQIWFDNPNFSD